jgi:ATP-binding cassette subfamily C exporter for protease/lipase
MMKFKGFFSRSDLTIALWQFRQEFVAVGAFSMVANILMLTPTLYMLQVYDRVLVSRSELTLLAVSLITLFLFFITALIEWMRSRILVRAGVRLDGVLSSRVFNASFEAHLNESEVDPSRAFQDMTEIRQFLTGNGIFAFFDAPWAPIYLGVLFFLHPYLGYLAIMFALIQVALAWFGHHQTVMPAEQMMKTQNGVNLYLQSKLKNAEVIESMGMLSNLRNRWQSRHCVYMHEHGTSHALTHRVTAWSKFIRYGQQSVSLAAGALLVIDGQLSPGAMVAANVLLSRALAPIDMLVGSWQMFIRARLAFHRIEELLTKHPERDPALTRVAPVGQIELVNVVATAPGREQPILKNISFSVLPATVNVVLGPSGSGKSTLARVLVGIWPEVQGSVLLDGLPIGGWDRVELGPYLGYLPQDVELFEGTIAENIARFAEVDSPKVIAAAKCAGLHEMVLKFPKGYDTSIGEAGNLLSGGQRQRIGLARAVYGDPVLVVLDEPNANLDDAGEAALAQAIQALKSAGTTVILITHRPGVLRLADTLLVLRDGAVQFNGPRDEVLAQMQAARSQAAGQSI